jgi:serine protease Do
VVDDQTNLSEDKASESTVVDTKVIHKRHNSKKIMALVAASCFFTAVFTVGAMSAAFLLGRSESKTSLNQTRQTVVQEGEVIADVAQKVSPSVVSIITEQQSQVSSGYFGSRTRKSQAAGTGLVIDSNGLILTNKHVVPEGITALSVVMNDGVKYNDVEVVGRDPLNDIAVIKVKNPKNFTKAALGDSDRVRIGQKVIAIGNALGQFQNTVTSGIISGMGRPVEAGDEGNQTTEQLTNLFQTDAAINSGNSGGPLLNYSGEVIGINTAVAADAENIGFAIPINEAKGIISSVVETGKFSRPFLGVKFVTLDPSIARELKLDITDGAYISTEGDSIVAGSPAEKAGVKPGDVITKVNNTKLSARNQLTSVISRFRVGQEVTLTIMRSGEELKLKAILSEAPKL